MLTAAAYAVQGLTVLEALLQAGLAIAPLVQEMKSTLTTMQDEGRDPTPAEWDALAAIEKQASDALDAAVRG